MSQGRLIYSARLCGLELSQVVTPQRIYIQNNFPPVSRAVCFQVLKFCIPCLGKRAIVEKYIFIFLKRENTLKNEVYKHFRPKYVGSGTEEAAFNLRSALMRGLTSPPHLSQPLVLSPMKWRQSHFAGLLLYS